MMTIWIDIKISIIHLLRRSNQPYMNTSMSIQGRFLLMINLRNMWHWLIVKSLSIVSFQTMPNRLREKLLQQNGVFKAQWRMWHHTEKKFSILLIMINLKIDNLLRFNQLMALKLTISIPMALWLCQVVDLKQDKNCIKSCQNAFLYKLDK